MAAQQQQSLSINDQLQQLGAARALVLADPVYWPQVVTGILPIVSGPSIELRRWGADFLAETFSTPVVDPKEKSKLALVCLDTLARLIEEKETGILKSAVQCSASVYPLIFRHICNNREDATTWNTMDSIKSKILSLWDSAPVGARVCCIKFVQRVILVQSKGFTDPRLADRSETSLSMVPTNHPLLSLPSLDAEAQGLLDRLLSIFHEDPSDPILITATLNNLASLIKTRLPLAPKIVGTILAFNPLAMASRASFISIKMRLMCQCMEKTVRVLLLNIMRSNPNGPFTGKISQHLSRLSQAKADLNEQASRKREAPVQEVEATKRLKTENTGAPNSSTSTPIQTPPRQPIVPTPVQQAITGPLTYAQLFTLSTDVAMTSFDGQQLPIDLVLQIVIGSIYSMSQSNLDAAIMAVRDRYNALLQASPPQAPLQAPSAALDQARADAQEPEPHENAQIHPKTEKEEEEEEGRGLQLGAFRLPTPPGLATEQLQQASLEAVDRMFTVIEEFEKISLVSKKKQLGVNRLAASNWDRDGWIMFLTRLATRGSSGINSEAISVKSEDGNASGLESSPALSAAIRERLYSYVITDFRGRLDIAVAWLNEEWYTDTIMARTDEGKNREPQYCKWMMKIMDGIFPYLESKDRMFMRLLSEIPEITLEVLGKVKMLCLDPDRAALGIQMLHYLAMLRPPVRGMCLDVLEDLWQNHPEVRTPAQKLLQKWRPEALVPRIKSEEHNPVIKDEGSNGVSQAHGNGATPVNA